MLPAPQQQHHPQYHHHPQQQQQQPAQHAAGPAFQAACCSDADALAKLQARRLKQVQARLAAPAAAAAAGEAAHGTAQRRTRARVVTTTAVSGMRRTAPVGTSPAVQQLQLQGTALAGQQQQRHDVPMASLASSAAASQPPRHSFALQGRKQAAAAPPAPLCVASCGGAGAAPAAADGTLGCGAPWQSLQAAVAALKRPAASRDDQRRHRATVAQLVLQQWCWLCLSRRQQWGASSQRPRRLMAAGLQGLQQEVQRQQALLSRAELHATTHRFELLAQSFAAWWAQAQLKRQRGDLTQTLQVRRRLAAASLAGGWARAWYAHRTTRAPPSACLPACCPPPLLAVADCRPTRPGRRCVVRCRRGSSTRTTSARGGSRCCVLRRATRSSRCCASCRRGARPRPNPGWSGCGWQGGCCAGRDEK